MSEIPPEIVERMVRLCRDMVRCLCDAPDAKHAVCCTAHGLEARAIAALLPDPDEQEARRVLEGRIFQTPGAHVYISHLRADVVSFGMACIKRGRELQRSES